MEQFSLYPQYTFPTLSCSTAIPTITELQYEAYLVDKKSVHYVNIIVFKWDSFFPLSPRGGKPIFLSDLLKSLVNPLYLACKLTMDKLSTFFTIEVLKPNFNKFSDRAHIETPIIF